MNSLVAYGSDSDAEDGDGQGQKHRQKEPKGPPKVAVGPLASSSSALGVMPTAEAAAPLVEPRPPRRRSDMFDDDDEADAFGSEPRRNKEEEDDDEEEAEEELDLLLEKGAKFTDSALLDVGGSGGGGSTPGPGYTPRSVCSTDDPMDTGAESPAAADAIHHRDLPPSPRGECDPEMAQRFIDFFEKKERGVDMNASIKRRKDYINPSLYESLRNAYGIDEKGTCFARSVYDPNAFSADDFYDALGDHQAAQEQRRKKMVQQQQQEQQHHHHSSKKPSSFPTTGGGSRK